MCLSASLTVKAATLFDESYTHPGAGGLALGSTQYLQTSWTQSTEFTDVTIPAWLFGDLVDGNFVAATGTACLTSTALGSPISRTFNFPTVAGAPLVGLFSGLTLQPGTYYLTLSTQSATGGSWSDSLNGSGGSLVDNRPPVSSIP